MSSALTALQPIAPPGCPVETATLTCVLLLSPLKGAEGHWRTQRQTFPVGDVLEAYLPEGEQLAQVTLSGAIIPPDRYDRVVPRAGDEIWLWPEWGLGVPELVAIGIALAVGLAVSAASHYLFPQKPLLLPRQNSMTEAEERTFSFEGIRTAVGPGGIVPVIYGQYRVGGQLLFAVVDQAYVVKYDGTAVVTKALEALETISTVRAACIVTDHGFQTGESVQISGVLSPTGANNSWVIEVLTPQSFTLKGSEHLCGAAGVPYGGGGVVKLLSRGGMTFQAVTAAPTLTLLIALGEGPIDAVLTDTIEINDQPIENFPGVEVVTALGTPDQQPLPGFSEVRNTFSDGRDIVQAAFLTYTTNGPLTAFVLNVVWNGGLYFMNERGEKESNGATLEYRYSPQGANTWSAFQEMHIIADRVSAVRIGIRHENLPLQAYDIQLHMLGATHVDDLRARWQPTLESVSEFLPGTQAYPNTALLGLRALATDALRGALPNVTVVVRGRRVRVGTLNPDETWSQNPAWCVMDLLTHPRYGRQVSDSEIDLTAFAVYAAYCDQAIDGSPRHTLNYVLDREQRAQTILLETMGGSRGLLMKTGGFWTPRPTRTETPTALLSWTDSTNLTLTYLQDQDHINVMEARFANELQDFEQDVLTWPSVEQWPAEVHKQSLDLRGITHPMRVQRALQYELNRRRFENVVLEMDCAASALTVQIHDLFRFAHPLPGWAVSGRVQDGSDLDTLVLDELVTFTAGESYVVYVRHAGDAIDVRSVINPGSVSQYRLDLASTLSQTPVPRMATWVFGRLSTEGDTRVFRVTSLSRQSNATVHLEAVIHNPSIYDDPTAEALPVITRLFNPLGPPPPLLNLLATEVTRIQASGASLRVVNLSWDVAPLGPTFAPYGGATILRRTLGLTGQAGQSQAGTVDFGVIQDPNDPNVNFMPLAQVRGHVLDFDDYTVISGGTYMYRVVPVSALGVPNNIGAREVLIHVAGPTTPEYFPGSVRNLRLRGQPVGVLEWEGRDIHFEWDPVAPSSLFSDTFFIQDYIVQLWAAGQLYLMRQTVVPLSAPGQSVQFSYTFEQNAEDQIRSGYAGAARTVAIYVWARTNTGRISLDVATITVTNPPPDMGDILPEATPLFQAGIIDFQQWAKPRDFSHFTVYLDTVAPPQAIYESEHTAFGKVLIATGDLQAGVTYYAQILPWDTFGPGIPSQITSFIPAAIDADSLDEVPPALPTGLFLTTGSQVSADGTIVPWVQANWGANTESDLAGYEVHFRVVPSLVPTVFSLDASQTSVRLQSVAGNVTVACKLLAYDQFHNVSPFTAEVSIVTGGDTTLPSPPTNLNAFGSFKAIALLWTPPADLDYWQTEVWSSFANNLAGAGLVGAAHSSFVHEGFASNATAYYWFRAKDTSNNLSAFVPGPLAGISATTAPTVEGDIGNLSITETKIAPDSISTPKLQANSVTANKVTTGELITLGAQIRSAIITNAHITTLSASKITAGVITALVGIGVGGSIYLDGVNNQLLVYDQQPALRVILGKLGVFSTDYGIHIFNAAGQLMWNLNDGAQTPGIADSAITAAKISAGVITAGHLRTDTAVITVAAQIANAIIADAHVTNLSASKLIAGRITAQISIGVSGNAYQSNIFLDGPNRNITIFDDSAGPQLRVLLGKLGAGSTDYGLAIWNAAGQLMWDLNSGSTTQGIADFAVTNAKIANATITDAKIDTLTASKITTGNLTAVVAVGGGPSVQLDGPNSSITIYDQTPTIRVVLGKLGGGSTDYGLLIRNAAGQDMWAFTSGATTRGITANAVTESLTYTAATTVTTSATSGVAGRPGYGRCHGGSLDGASARRLGRQSDVPGRARQRALAGELCRPGRVYSGEYPHQ